MRNKLRLFKTCRRERFLIPTRNPPAEVDQEVEDLEYEAGEERRALSARVLPMSLNLELDQWDGSHQDLDHLGEPCFFSGYHIHHSETGNQKTDFNSIHYGHL